MKHWLQDAEVAFAANLQVCELPLSVTSYINTVLHVDLSHSICPYRVIMTLHFLNDVANDTESAQKIDQYVIFTSLKSKSTWYADK